MRLSRQLRGKLEADERFYRAERPWLLLREEDATLIVPPNRVYKLDGVAVKIARWLDEGRRLLDLPGLDDKRAADLSRFFDELRAACEGGEPAGGFGRRPYGFDFTRLPILGEAALTYRCNARCLFCYAACGDDARGGAAELSTGDWKNIIDIFKREARIPFFSFTGGEPLIRADLEELAAHARSLGLRTNLITNGTLATSARAASLKASGIDSAQVSLESPEASIHDRLCGLPGAWDLTIRGIRALMAAGLAVQTNSTLTRENRESLGLMPEFLKALGVRRFSMNLFIPSGRGLAADKLFVPYSEVASFVDDIRRAAHHQGLTFFWYSPTPYCLYNPVARGMGNKSCAAADGLVHVNPSGDILPCSSWPEPLGNILKRPFGELWFSDRAAYFKNKRFAPESCHGCESFSACQGACPLYWRYAGEAELCRAEVIHAE